MTNAFLAIAFRSYGAHMVLSWCPSCSPKNREYREHALTIYHSSPPPLSLALVPSLDGKSLHRHHLSLSKNEIRRKKMMEKKDKKEAGEGRAGEGGRVVAGGL